MERLRVYKTGVMETALPILQARLFIILREVYRRVLIYLCGGAEWMDFSEFAD